MTLSRFVSGRITAALACLTVACCVPQSPEPTPPPAARPAPTPQPSPTLSAPANWMDAPRTAGDWFYEGGRQTTSASFGPANSEARFTIRCDRRDRTITLIRAGEATGPTPMRVLTETRERLLTANPLSQALPTIGATLRARDPILDAMAFSKGRFAVETPRMPSLYLPSWPEVTRVIEDCR